MTRPLTKRSVDQTKPSEGDIFIWDSELKGFGLKVTPAGKKVFIYQYRTGGRGTPTKRATLGKYGDITPDQARVHARRYAGVVAEGRDPRLEEKQRQSVAAQESANTFARLVADFIDTYAKKHQRTWQETKRLLHYDPMAVWAKRPAASLTRREVVALVQTVADRAPITANRLRAALRKLFNWAVATGRVDASPVSGIPRPARERPRDRVLSKEELGRVFAAAGKIAYPFGPFFKLLVLTAQRVQEVAGIRWSEIQGNEWIIPAERAKNGKAHVVHLNAPALTILSTIPRHAGRDLVFTVTGVTPISGFSKAKARLDRLAGVTGWRDHDIRRTVVTGLANLGHPPHVCDKILNHVAGTISGVAAVYQRAEFSAERQAALDEWGQWVSGIGEKEVARA